MPPAAQPRPPQWDAMAKHEFAQYVLEEKGSYFPSLAEMKASGPPRDTVDGLQRSINEKQSEFTNDLDKLYQHQAQRYLDDAYDRYLSFEEAECVVMSNKPPSTLPNFRDFYLQQRRFLSGGTRSGKSTDPIAPSGVFSDEVAQYTAAHYKSVHPLQDRLARATKNEEELRRRREAMFPATIGDYRSIRNKDVQLRIARFLTADSTIQGKMMTEFNWAWRQTKPLQDEYLHDDAFKAEVQTRVKDVEVRDPRRKPSAPQLG
ncbi:uncharacterized protein STEHIDRAFT_135316 [Stereum hirsutum FP-91666 SS1]|uniref:Uncharacterized protein n=1 Tax=Stereum hirsutum (strain FP-91666) TaxID=721885 RepID=R7RYF3_STEHR|nr:uncharacterized protein STEHIDRAFT_135316 [Stereum hirsutum FP-91666 SS1]EIM80436.1 hypothetical protein STEHIDRAFT_135316 [Stereum hirsutum FP-91666 SS1]